MASRIRRKGRLNGLVCEVPQHLRQITEPADQEGELRQERFPSLKSPTMCNLYSMTRNREAILRLFRISDNRAAAYQPQNAIFPGYQAPVVRKAADGERELAVLNWGFLLLQDGRAPKRVTNVRDDKALTRFWRPSIEQRRCLVPASSYCEPKGEKPATWHWFSVNGDDARPLFAFPGVWTRYRGQVRKNGETVEQEVFAFLTTEPNELTASINHERMPVLLSDPAEFETWLSAPAEEALRLARSYAAEKMCIVQSGSEREDLLGAA
jgi:putative SOS response-associated peptidase YedK